MKNSVLILFGALIVAALSTQVLAQDKPYTPQPGTPERKLIMDALRVPLQKDLKRDLIFEVQYLKVQSGWAFIIARPKNPDGSPVDYSTTRYRESVEAGAFDDQVIALLSKRAQGWTVRIYVLGATDVPYVDWPKKYKAPRAIFYMP